MIFLCASKSVRDLRSYRRQTVVSTRKPSLIHFTSFTSKHDLIGTGGEKPESFDAFDVFLAMLLRGTFIAVHLAGDLRR